MIRAFKYRMYPTPKQLAVMEHQFGLCRWLHNCALEHRITSFKAGKPVSYKDQANELPQFKESFPDFKRVHSQILARRFETFGPVISTLLSPGKAG